MILIINGSFGVGKTTVAERLGGRIAGAVVYDPERWGYVLQRVPAWTFGRRARVEDFQDVPLWRGLVASGVRRAHRSADLVIVPMAFTNATYLAELTDALKTEAEVKTLCLVAPLDVINERLLRRAEVAGRPVSEFERRRSQECVAAHASPVFGSTVDATRAVDDIAAEIAARLHI